MTLPMATTGEKQNGDILPKGVTKNKKFIHLNVSGMKYITLKETLDEFPGTLLGNEERRRSFYVEALNAYYFDRHRECFEAILYYYQSGGTLFRPSHVPMDVFVREARFFGISSDVIANLHKLEGYLQEENEEEEDFEMPVNDFQRRMWLLFDSPDSSFPARIIGCVSILIILVSIVAFCLETVPQYHNTMYVGQHVPGPTEPTKTLLLATTKGNNVNDTPTVTGTEPVKRVINMINIIEVVSISWFSIEYLLRLTFSPNKWTFFKSFLNLIDLVAILPFFVVMLVKSETGSSLAVVRVARLTRVFRIFKLSRHSMGLQILGSTLKASMKELCMMLVVICFSVIMFSSAIYYAEHEGVESTFNSIPSAFWYLYSYIGIQIIDLYLFNSSLIYS